MSMADITPPGDFDSAARWADAYRALGMSVVPVREGKSPAEKWRELQAGIPQFTHDRWYGEQGDHRENYRMGFLTGQTHHGQWKLLVIDLDEKDGASGSATWDAWIGEHDYGVDPETWRARTGGGGQHLYFKYPADLTVKTTKYPHLGLDIRADGGFIMAPPSTHPNGKPYTWEFDPFETELADAPQWLLDKLETTNAAPRPPAARPETAPGAADAFGRANDGREDLMHRMIFAVIVSMYRESPIQVSEGEATRRMTEAYEAYARRVTTKRPGATLEDEGRGITEFTRKWRATIQQWDTKIAEAAADPNYAASAGSEPFITSTMESVPPGPLILTGSEFISRFTPPKYLIDGILQRGYLYSLTARTGHGKTVVSMYMAQAIARGVDIQGREVAQGSVIFLAGENPDDIRARYLVLADHHGFDIGSVPIHFIDGTGDIATWLPRIQAEAGQIDNLQLVVVDTAAAYFRGDDDNSNTQKAEFARLLRQLTFLPGKPAVIVNSHPIKNAQKDNLLPVGGGAFLNEVDGNLTLWSEGEQHTELHWQGKFRGPEFEPISFKMSTVTCDAVRDDKGRHMPSVVAHPASDMDVELAAKESERNEELVMQFLHAKPKASFADIARGLGWVSEDGKPRKSTVHKVVHRLVGGGYVKKVRGGKYRLTPAGEKDIGVASDDDTGAVFDRSEGWKRRGRYE